MPIATALSRFSPLAPLRRRRQLQQPSSSETSDPFDEKSLSPSPSPLSGSERSYEMRTISARKARVLLPQQQAQPQRQKRQQQQQKQRPTTLTTAQSGSEAERVWKEFWI